MEVREEVDKEDSRNPVTGRCYGISPCVPVKQQIVLDSSGGGGKV